MKVLSIIFTVAVLLLSLSACAPATGVKRAEIEYSRADYRNQFIENRARCRATGGRIVIMGWGGSVDRNGIPRTRVRYSCS